jgi:hypothetical protein
MYNKVYGEANNQICLFIGKKKGNKYNRTTKHMGSVITLTLASQVPLTSKLTSNKLDTCKKFQSMNMKHWKNTTNTKVSKLFND